MKKASSLATVWTICSFLSIAIVGSHARELSACNTTFSFLHGVASGDPDHTSIVLWTRVTPSDDVSPNDVFKVRWVVSKKADLSKVVAGGKFKTNQDRDFTVKLLASGLKSQKQYYYAFFIGDAVSPTGKFRLPAAPGKPQAALKYAVVSCSNWGFGYFNAYDAMSKVQDLDFWMHVGDYIYEYGVGVYPSAAQSIRPLSELKPTTRLVTLSDYRLRYALYHEDPASIALHAAAPLIAIWDDHELANNVYNGGSQQHNETTDGPWAAQLTSAVRVFHEWLPTRYFMDDGAYVKVWRSYTFGDLATLAVLETRITARTDSNRRLDTPLETSIYNAFSDVASLGVGSVAPSAWNASLISSIQALAAKYDAYRNMTNLTIIGNGEQMEWIKKTVSAKTKWQLIGQGTVMLESYGPDFEKAIEMQTDPAIKALWLAQYTNLTADLDPNATITGMSGVNMKVAAVKGTARVLEAMGKYRVNWNFDSWGGYQVNKRQLLQTLKSATNAVIYGGDSHNSWAGVESIDGMPVAAEFNSPGVTSPGFERSFGYIPKDLMEAGMVAADGPFGMKYNEIKNKGYMLVTLDHCKHHMEYVYVSTILSTDYTAKCDYAVDTPAGDVGTWNKVACNAM